MTATIKFDGFEWDSGNWPKCAKRGLSKAEIEFALTAGPLVLPDRSPATPETRFNAVGKTQSGRHVFAVFTMRHYSTTRLLRPISARYMHEKEINHYEQTKG